MFWRPPEEKELIAFGFRLGDYKSPEVEVWPENWQAIDLYSRNHTQMIVGAAGPVGLNYAWFQSCLDRQDIDAKEIGRIMGGIRVIEGIVLDRAYEAE